MAVKTPKEVRAGCDIVLLPLAAESRDFDDLMGDPKKSFRAVVFNPVPGPPMGDRTRLALILKGKKLGFTLGEISQMIAVEEGEADANALTLSREKCLEQIELLKRQKAEIEEGLNELSRIYSSLTGKIADKDRRAG